MTLSTNTLYPIHQHGRGLWFQTGCGHWWKYNTWM